MKAVFVELPAFGRHRADYLDDLAFGDLQLALMRNPEAGVIGSRSGGVGAPSCNEAKYTA